MEYQCDRVPLRRLESDWRALEGGNRRLTPQQYYDYIRVLDQQYWPYRLRGENPEYYRLCDAAGKCVLLAPMARKSSDGHLTTFGTAPKIAFQGFVWDIDAPPDFDACFRALFRASGAKRIVMNHVRADSPMFAFAEKAGRRFKTHDNAGIPLPENSEEYLASLSKSTRQNLRTAVNRLSREGHTFGLQVIRGREYTPAIEKEIMRCYLKRRSAKRGGATAVQNYFTKHIHYNSVAFRRLDNCTHFLYRVDGKVAAFMSGYTDHGNTTYLVPRLAYDDSFNFYDPGNLLILTSAQWLMENTPVRLLDLSRGDDGYKYKMGGEKYFTYDYEFINTQE